jgi:hypothetical protein
VRQRVVSRRGGARRKSRPFIALTPRDVQREVHFGPKRPPSQDRAASSPGKEGSAMSLRHVLLASTFVWSLSLALPASASAQPLIILLFGDKLVSPNFQSGLNVSFAGTGLMGIHHDMKLSWSIGCYGEFRLSRRLSLQPEILLKNPGGARDLKPGLPGYPFSPPGEPMLDQLVREGRVTREFRSIAFPLSLKTYFGRFGIAAGLQLSVLLKATDTVSLKHDDDRLSQKGDVRSMRRADLGATVGVEYALTSGDHLRALRIRARTVLGMIDTMKDNPGSALRNWALFIGLDVPIGRPKAPPKQT